MVVIDFNETQLKLVNPQIIVSSGVQECVTLQALNEYGKEIIVVGEGEMAKCFCHELEHLDGEIFLDKAVEEITI